MNTHYPFNPQLNRVTEFEIVSDYTIRLTFDDQTERVIDFEPILTGPLFGPLKDKILFEQVKLDETFGTLEWPNGADISPEVLHDWPAHIEAIVARRQREKAPA
jgi:hypothetical protein